ncbi:hypothetical protein SK128_003635, partial [Halocaridina rubra]
KNRVVVVSMASFMWTIFLSYMHHLDQETLPVFLRRKSAKVPAEPAVNEEEIITEKRPEEEIQDIL